MNRILFKLGCALIVSMVCAYLAWRIAATSNIRFGAVAVSDTTGTERLVYGYAMTLIGVFIGSAYRALERLRQLGHSELPDVRAFFGSVFKSIDFWLGVCGSPLVYALLLRATDGGSTAGLTAIAIENGFFCTMIVAKLAPGFPSKPKPAKAPGRPT